VTAVLIAILGIGVFAATRRGAITPSAVDALHLQPAVLLSGPPALALSPDGSRLAYVARRDGASVLCVHAMESATTTCLPGTEDAAGPFFSPDSRWIGFFAGRALKKVPVEGQAVQLISESRGGRIGHWESDDTILLATPTNGIMRVAASGGNMEVVVPLLPTDGPFAWPMLLPSGDTVLFTVAAPGGGFGAGWIVACSLSTGRRTTLFPGSQPHFDESTGRLSWTLHGRIVSVRFDPVTLKSAGPFVPAVTDVLVTPDGGPQVAYGGRGTIAYAPGSLLPVVRRQIVWVDRAGVAVPLPLRKDVFQTPRVSPDGGTLVVGIRGVTTDLWKYDLATGAESRLTFTAPTNDTPVWAPNGGIAFRVPLGSGSAVLVTPNGGNETDALRLWEGGGILRLGAWSTDGRTMVGTQAGDLWILNLDAIGASRSTVGPRDRWRTILTQTAPVELGPVLSPDGRYVAYSSDETGRSEIYVQAVTDFSHRWQVSTIGGSEPVWAGRGRELFYRSGDAMMVVSVATQPAFSAGAPRILFRGAYLAGDGLTNYDVSPDGRRFLMVRDDDQAPAATSLTIKTSRPVDR
jgi:Tol biopolymer transport system component